MGLSAFVKTPEEIEKMREAGRLTASVFTFIDDHVRKGITTEELDRLCHDFIVNECGATPAPLGYHGYPKSICTSANHVVCHGIPSNKKLKDGDALNIDISIIKNGYCGDSAKMYFIGKVPLLAQRLSQITQECLYRAIDIVKPGISLRDIGRTIERHARKHGFSVVHEFCGHGIGKELHEGNFQVVHYDNPEGEKMILEPGLTFTIEPMINAGRRHIRILPDGWTVVTKDHSLSAQWEHTLLVTETGCDILTLRPEESI